MKFGFIPYQLGTAIHQIQGDLKRVLEDSDADFFQVENPSITIPGIPISHVHLSFHNGRLISVYMNLADETTGVHHLLLKLIEVIGEPAEALAYQEGLAYCWSDSHAYFAIMSIPEKRPILCYALIELSDIGNRIK